MSVQRIYQGAGHTQDQTKGAILQELLDLQILKRPQHPQRRVKTGQTCPLVRSISFDDLCHKKSENA